MFISCISTRRWLPLAVLCLLTSASADLLQAQCRLRRCRSVCQPRPVCSYRVSAPCPAILTCPPSTISTFNGCSTTSPTVISAPPCCSGSIIVTGGNCVPSSCQACVDLCVQQGGDQGECRRMCCDEVPDVPGHLKSFDCQACVDLCVQQGGDQGDCRRVCCDEPPGARSVIHFNDCQACVDLCVQQGGEQGDCRRMCCDEPPGIHVNGVLYTDCQACVDLCVQQGGDQGECRRMCCDEPPGIKVYPGISR